jgi:hypothetical protein
MDTCASSITNCYPYGGGYYNYWPTHTKCRIAATARVAAGLMRPCRRQSR